MYVGATAGSCLTKLEQNSALVSLKMSKAESQAIRLLAMFHQPYCNSEIVNNTKLTFPSPGTVVNWPQKPMPEILSQAVFLNGLHTHSDESKHIASLLNNFEIEKFCKSNNLQSVTMCVRPLKTSLIAKADK